VALLTNHGKSELSANYGGIRGSPEIITNCAPSSGSGILQHVHQWVPLHHTSLTSLFAQTEERE